MDSAELTASSQFGKDIKGPSVTFVGLTARIEDELDVMVSRTQEAAAKTLGQLAALIDTLADEEA